MKLTTEQQRLWGRGRLNVADINKPTRCPPKVTELERVTQERINTGAIWGDMLQGDFITDNKQVFSELLSRCDAPIILADYTGEFNTARYKINVAAYTSDLKKENVTNLIENRHERQENKAKRVYLFVNALNDYKLNLNYITRRGATCGVSLVAVADALPKGADFKSFYINGVLSLDGVAIRTNLKPTKQPNTAKIGVTL